MATNLAVNCHNRLLIFTLAKHWTEHVIQFYPQYTNPCAYNEGVVHTVTHVKASSYQSNCLTSSIIVSEGKKKIDCLTRKPLENTLQPLNIVTPRSRI